MPPVLTLESVTKRYRRRGPWVLSGAELSLEPGTLSTVVGSNGCGKSTLLRIAAGVTSPTGGRASVPPHVGYVPERQAAQIKFTASEYAAHMGRIRGLSSAECASRADELWQRLGLLPGPDVIWNNLSKGNRQKVVIAQAFLGCPDAVILDEPFSGLDEGAHTALDELLGEVLATGASVVVSGHHAVASDRVYRLVQGRLTESTASATVAGGTVITRRAGPSTERRRVVLSCRTRRRPVTEITTLDGVVRWEIPDDGAHLVVEVSSERCDDLLAVALRMGWSVETVHAMGTKR